MKTNIELVLSGIGGVVVGVGTIALLVACAGEPAATTATARTVEPLPAPALAPELATTTPASAVIEREPEVESYEPELAGGAIRVRRLIVATGVAQREPTGAADVFELGESPRLYAFVEAVNETGEPAPLEITFEPERGGESAGHVSVVVPARAPRFRTWAYTRHIYTEGRWEAVVRAPDGRVIARRPFDVE